MIDIHAHVLPGVDDGARDWDQALELCRQAYAGGTPALIATPDDIDHITETIDRALVKVLGPQR